MEFIHCYVILIIVLIDIFSSYPHGHYGQPFINLPKIVNSNQRSTYELVKPVLYRDGKRLRNTFDKTKHVDKANLIFDAFNKHFVIDLDLNRHLFTKSYIEKTFNEYDEPVITKPTNQLVNHCYYHGTVRGVPHSIVSISSCKGIRGHITDHEQSYYIEPIGDEGFHKVYADSDTRPSFINHDDLQFRHSMILDNATVNTLHRKEFLQRSKRSTSAPYEIKDEKKKFTIRPPANSNQNSKYVELYIVNDNSVYRQHRRNKNLIFRRSQEIANYVSKLYQPLNIYIALVGVEIWTVRDKVAISNQANKTLDNFLSYRRQSINPRHPNDNAQLITGVLFRESIVGKAIKMSICTYQYSAGVVMDADSTAQVATTMAHELGHNFGMEHDNYSVCLCAEPKCIMATTGGGYKNPTKWSSCSQTVLNDNFEIGLDYCLRNIPEQLLDEPYCGNGFVEEGEQCDCGLPQNCESKCCNATSCKLYSHAKCATGRCCDLNSCQPKSAATLCRPSPNECDLPEFCDGETEYCPTDVFIENGKSCSAGQAYCFNGTCKTPTGQCKLLWGSTGRVSDPICFKMLNINGSKYGNCGYNWTSRKYERCDKADVDCGLLHCVHLNEKLMFWSEKISKATPATFLTKGDKKHVCRSAIMDVGLDMPDPGQVPEGSKCGDSRICLKKKCVPLSVVRTPRCPDCHGNGVCNTLGQCHCDEGFAPPYCDEPGHGGSIHSGPVKIQKVNGVMIGLLIFFLVICPIIIIIVAVLNRKRLYVCWNKQIAVILYRVPKFPRKSKGQKKDPSNGTNITPEEPRPRLRNGGVDISGPLLTDSTREDPQPPTKRKFPDFKVLKPHSKPKPPPKQKSEALLSHSESEVQRKLPSAPELFRNDPIVKKESFRMENLRHDPIVKKDSFNKDKLMQHELVAKKDSSNKEKIKREEIITKKDSFNKEISKPVLISTTDRRSKAFVRESSNEKLKDANRNNIAPPVPPHASLKPTLSDPPLKPPPRPISMPPPPMDGKKEDRVKARKSVMEPVEQMSPPRPPPPKTKFTLGASDNTPPLPRVQFNPAGGSKDTTGKLNSKKKEEEKEKGSNPPAISKFKPEKKTSTNAAKNSIESKKTDSSDEKKPLRVPAEPKTKSNKSVISPREKMSKLNSSEKSSPLAQSRDKQTPKLPSREKQTPQVKPREKQAQPRDKSSSQSRSRDKSSSSSKVHSSEEAAASQPNVSAMRAMFDQNDSSKESSPGTRPRLAPKPGSKVRSVNV